MNGASPYANTPPSAAASQEPLPVAVAAIPTTGAWRESVPADPMNGASPYANTPPSAAASQYPLPVGVLVAATAGLLRREVMELRTVCPPGATTMPSSVTMAYGA